MGVEGANGNVELTREVLRAELRAGLAEQTISFNRTMDARFEPVNEHIARIDRGEFSDAQKAAILTVIRGEKVEIATLRNLKMPILALVVSIFTLLAMVGVSLFTAGVFA